MFILGAPFPYSLQVLLVLFVLLFLSHSWCSSSLFALSALLPYLLLVLLMLLVILRPCSLLVLLMFIHGVPIPYSLLVVLLPCLLLVFLMLIHDVSFPCSFLVFIHDHSFCLLVFGVFFSWFLFALLSWLLIGVDTSWSLLNIKPLTPWCFWSSS